MSDREFDNYLTLLTGLLRLNPKQRRAIAAELQSHLEDRLEDLLARGISHDDAVRQALAEFGDAAGLAGQFGAISAKRKRRWLMRVTTFSVAATLLLAAGIATFWPGRNAAPGAAHLAAQDAAKSDDKKPAIPPQQAEPANEPTLEERLNQRIDVDFVESPLKDAIAFIADNTAIQFVFRFKKLEEASVSIDSPVTTRLRRVRISTLLDIILGDQELTYVDRDGLVFITTPEDAENALQTRVYDCRDLLRMEAPPGADKFLPSGAMGGRGMGGGFGGGFGGGMFAVEDQVPAPASPNGKSSPQPAVAASSPPAAPYVPRGATGGMGGVSGAPSLPVSEHDLRAVRLIEIVTGTVRPDSWDDVGGPGSISEYNGLIVISQTTEVHKQVERLFDMLREAAGLEVSKTGKVVR
jgi:hypothetical protein